MFSAWLFGCFYPQYSAFTQSELSVILRAIWVGPFLTRTTWSLYCTLAIVSVTQRSSGHLSLRKGQHLRHHPWCLINKPGSLASTEPYWMHLLSPQQSNSRDGSWARRVLQSVRAIRPPLETSGSDKPRVFDGKNGLPSFINLKQRAFFFFFFAPLFCALTDKAWRARSGVKDILCRPAVRKR